MRTARHELIAHNIAVTLLSGVWSETAMLRRICTYLGGPSNTSRKRLVAEIFEHVREAYPPSLAELTRLVLEMPSFERAATAILRSRAPVRMVLRAPHFGPVKAMVNLDLPRLRTSGDVARWLALPIEELDWFTDARRQHGRTAIPILQHYTYFFRSRALKPPRLIEAPKPRLKTMQRKILRDILAHVPTHDAAHGFVKGRSCRTGASLHVAADVVVRLDIADFFLTTPVARIEALLRNLGYPEGATEVLCGLCTTTTPASVLDRLDRPAKHTRAALARYQERHLPQGGPTSPALANLVAWRLDQRLTGLARSYGAIYTRYADDMVFSGHADFSPKVASLISAVAGIVADEGYELNESKTRVMTRSQRQQVTGIVVNEHLNAARNSYDVLKAILHNCKRNGLEAENRDGLVDFRAHLEGRVGWIESLNPLRGRRLRAMLLEIE